jgi:hypothetical protein
MANPGVVSKLLALADGDIDRLRAAIHAAADGGISADLEKIVDFIVRQQRATLSDARVTPTSIDDA